MPKDDEKLLLKKSLYEMKDKYIDMYVHKGTLMNDDRYDLLLTKIIDDVKNLITICVNRKKF